MNVGLGNNCGTLNYLLHTDVFNKLNVSLSESYIPTLIDNIENSHVFLTSSQQQMQMLLLMLMLFTPFNSQSWG